MPDYETTPEYGAWVEARRTAVEVQRADPGGGDQEVGAIPGGSAPGPAGLRWGKLSVGGQKNGPLGSTSGQVKEHSPPDKK